MSLPVKCRIFLVFVYVFHCFFLTQGCYLCAPKCIGEEKHLCSIG